MSQIQLGGLVLLAATIASSAPALAAPEIGLDAPATITFSPPALAFPDTLIGFLSAAQTVTVTNTGASTVSYSLSLPGDFTTSLDDVDCSDDPCSLSPGGSLTVTVTFTPHTSGALAEALTFVADTSTASLALTGNATGGVISLEQPTGFSRTLSLGNALIGAATAPGTIRIRNTGNAAIHVAAAFPVIAEAAAFSIISGPAPPFDLHPDATAEWQIVCRPIRIGANDAEFEIESNAGTAEFQVALGCAGDGRALAVDGGSLQLPTTSVGGSSSASLVLRNTGDLPVTISSATAGNSQFVIAPPGGGFPITVAAGATASFPVTFTPTTGGLQDGQLVIASDSTLPLAGALRGIGHTGHIDFAPQTVDAGLVPVGTPASVTSQLSNNSDQLLTITSITISDPVQVQVTTPMLVGAAFAPDDAFPIALQIMPAVGAQDVTVSFALDQGSPSVLHVTANGAAPGIAVAFNGSPVGSSAAFGEAQLDTLIGGIVSLTNTGTAALHLTTCKLVGDGEFVMMMSPCPTEVIPGASVDLTLVFEALRLGGRTATLQITSDASPATLSVPLTGIGTSRGGDGCSAGTGQRSGLLLLGALLLLRRRARRRGKSAVAHAAVALLASCSSSTSSPPPPRSGGSLISVALTGSGQGTVQSIGREIDCGSICQATFPDGAHLAATAADGSVFAGWSGPCAGTGPCIVPPAATPTEVTARFERPLHFAVTADAATTPFSGEITINGELCPLPCNRDVLTGAQLTLDAFTLSTFAGWSGGCPAGTAPCMLTVTADTSVVAQFTAPYERWTAVDDDLVPEAVTVLDDVFDTDNAIVAGAPTDETNDIVLARYSDDGTQLWSTRIAEPGPSQVIGLGHPAEPVIYLLTHTDSPTGLGAMILHAFDVNGQFQWNITLTATPVAFGDLITDHPFRNHSLAVSPDGPVVIIGQDTTSLFVRGYNDQGTNVWTQTLTTEPQAALVGSDGSYTITSQDQFERGFVDRFAADGTPLGHFALPELPSENFPEFSFQAFALAGDQLVCSSASDVGDAIAIRGVDATTGAPAWQLDDLSPALLGDLQLTDDRLGGVLVLDQQNALRKLTGRTIAFRRVPDHVASPGGADDIMVAHDLAADSQGGAIEVGAWLRACAAGESCDGDHCRVRGFVRRYVP